MKKSIFMSMLAGSVALMGSSACLAQSLKQSKLCAPLNVKSLERVLSCQT